MYHCQFQSNDKLLSYCAKFESRSHFQLCHYLGHIYLILYLMSNVLVSAVASCSLFSISHLYHMLTLISMARNHEFCRSHCRPLAKRVSGISGRPVMNRWCQ